MDIKPFYPYEYYINKKSIIYLHMVKKAETDGIHDIMPMEICQDCQKVTSGRCGIHTTFYYRVVSILIGICLIALYATVGWSGTWTEDFSTGLKEWEVYQFQKGAEKWESQDGVAVGEIFKIGFMSLLLINQSAQWTNYAISCKVKFSKIGEEVKQLPEVGLVLYHHPKEDTRYVFTLRSNGSGSFSKRNNGLGEVVVFETKRYPSGVWITLRAEVQGNTLIFSINNDVISANDKSPLSIGQAGLMVANAIAHFDDVIVSGDSIPNRKTSALNTEPKGKLPTIWGEVREIYGRYGRYGR